MVDADPVNLKPVYALSPELKALSSYPDLAPTFPATFKDPPIPTPPATINAPVVVEIDVFEFANIAAPD